MASLPLSICCDFQFSPRLTLIGMTRGRVCLPCQAGWEPPWEEDGWAVLVATYPRHPAQSPTRRESVNARWVHACLQLV